MHGGWDARVHWSFSPVFRGTAAGARGSVDALDRGPLYRMAGSQDGDAARRRPDRQPLGQSHHTPLLFVAVLVCLLRAVQESVLAPMEITAAQYSRSDSRGSGDTRVASHHHLVRAQSQNRVAAYPGGVFRQPRNTICLSWIHRNKIDGLAPPIRSIVRGSVSGLGIPDRSPVGIIRMAPRISKNPPRPRSPVQWKSSM